MTPLSRRLVTLAFLAGITGLPADVLARCGDAPGDLTAVCTARAVAEDQCHCATATSHGRYVRCVAQAANAEVTAGHLPRQCKHNVVRCAARSTCGKPGFVTCCRFYVGGTERCSIKRSATTCKPPSGGSAVVGALPSCCDACVGGCVGTTTTSTTLPGATTTSTSRTTSTSTSSTTVIGSTTSSSSSTSTSTTTVPPCGNGMIDPGEQCDGNNVGGAMCNSPGGAFNCPVCNPDCTLNCNCCQPDGMCASTTTTSTTTSSSTSSSSSSSTSVTSSTVATTSTSSSSSSTSSNPPSSTSTSRTTSTSTSSTTSTTIAACCGTPTPTKLTFTTGFGTGNCGIARNFDGTTFTNLACGGLYFGGGQNSVPLPAVIPDMGASVTKVTSCTNNKDLVLAATANGELGATMRTCTKVGCFFGPPLPIPNTASTPTSTCVINSVATDAAGTADCTTGGSSISLPLNSEIFLAGDLFPARPGIQPCPICAHACVSANPAFNGITCTTNADCGVGGTCPAGTTCHGGPNDGNACVPGNTSLGTAGPTTHDCPNDTTLDIGGLPIGFALTTGPKSYTAVASGTQNRVFCGYCRDADGTGSFQQPAKKCLENNNNKFCAAGCANVGVSCSVNGDCTGCAGGCQAVTCSGTNESCEQKNAGGFGPAGGTVKTITETGVPGGSLTDHALHNSTLVSVFCIPPTFNPTVDNAADLPGPGSVALAGQTQLQ